MDTALAQIQQVDQLLPTVEVLKNMKQVADYMVSAGMLPPGYKKGEDLMVVGLRGRELGVPMGQAIQGMFPMHGRIGYMGGFLLSMVKNRLPNSDIRIKESTKERCVLEWRRNKEDAYLTEEYTMEEVKACHYDQNPVKGSDGYQKADASGNLLWKPKPLWGDPKNMLYWRCVTRTINRWFSDVFGSPVYTADEMQDMDIIDITPAGKAAASVPYRTEKTEEAVIVQTEEPTVVSGDPKDIPVQPPGKIEPIPVNPLAPPLVAEVVDTVKPTEGVIPPPHPEEKQKMTQNMVDAIVTQYEKDIFAQGVTKKFIDEKFEDLKKMGLPGKVLTTCFNLKKQRIEQIGGHK